MSWREIDEICRKTRSKEAEAHRWYDSASFPSSKRDVFAEINQDIKKTNHTRKTVLEDTVSFRQGGVFQPLLQPETLQAETDFMRQTSKMQRKSKEALQKDLHNTLRLHEETEQEKKAVEISIKQTNAALRQEFQEKRRKQDEAVYPRD